ncbi:MAG: pectin acetylesterase, partial [Rubrivivax sp.]
AVVGVQRRVGDDGAGRFTLAGHHAGQDGQLFDIALQDGLLALDHLATLPPLPLLHVGLSSGGHLAGVMACQRESAGAVIAYAPLNANHREHKFPAGKPDFLPPEKQAFYDAWPIGIAAEPHGLPKCPVFLAYALHDAIVPVQHALNLVVAAQQHGLDVEAHVFPQAEHGFALRGLAGTHGQWPALAARWMAARLTT